MLNTDDTKLQLRRLNTDVHNPCYLLYMRDVNLLLDCCLDLSNLSYFLPNHQLMSPGCSDLPHMVGDRGGDMFTKLGDINYINTGFKFCMLKSSEMSSIFWETVDAILVSNTRSILGLPFLFENTKFRGKIFATEPVVKFGKILIDDLLSELDQLAESQSVSTQPNMKASGFTDATDHLMNSGEYNWTKFYTRESVTKALDRVHLVAYHEPVDIFGLLTIKGLSAGYGIGSCNWIITSSTEKVAYISHTSLLHSHVLPFDESGFEDTDILIVGTVNMYANSQLEKAVEEFCHIVVQTLARGGNVLVPSNPCGIIFDLLETAIRAKDNFSGNILPLFPHDQPTVNKNNHINHNNNSNNDAGNPTNMVTTTVNSQSNNKTTFNSATPSNTDSIVVNNYAQSAIRNSSITSSGGSSSSGRVARSPVFILSNQVHVSLAYSNAYGEWLNAAKEAVLYTADSPFPFQSLLQSGELVALKSLYDSSSSKKLLSDSSSGVYSSRILTSPLLLGPANSSSSGGYFETGGSNSSNPISTTAAANLDPAILALTTSTVRDSSNNNHNVSGGIWPNSPCLIFASHPSLRLGPSVHLTRALAYGSLRSGNRSSIPSHHSVILIESGDYVPSYECNSKLLCSPETHLRRVITPFLQSENISANRTTFSQSGTPALSISDTATVYWLPMEARIGVNQINQLVKRCGEPRLALILPQEVCDQPMILTNITATSEQLTTKIHGISYSQQLCLSLPDSRLQQVRVSSKLVSTIKPVYITLQSENFNSITNSSVDKTSDNKKQVNSTQNELDYHHSSGKSELKRKLSSTPPRTPPPVVTSTSSDNMSKELSGVIEKQSSDEAAGQDKRTCIALVNGLLTTRDGKHWLIGKEERLEPDSTQPVKDFLRPSTPPPPALSTMTTTTPNHSANGPAKDRNQKFNLNTKVNIEHRVLVNCNSHSPRINPCELIQKLTERGVTGAYLADPLTARQMYARYAMYNSKHCDSINNEDVILFPNPNTMICLTDHGSHIIAMDESTRTTIRDTILPFLQYLETRSTVQL